MDTTVAFPVTYSFGSYLCTVEGTYRVEARSLAEAFAQLPHSHYQFIEAFDANGTRVYG